KPCVLWGLRGQYFHSRRIEASSYSPEGGAGMRGLALAGCSLVLLFGLWSPVRADTDGGKDVSIKGEVIDTFCYATMGAKGASHKQCGIECAHKGIPVGLLDPSGKIHILLP